MGEGGCVHSAALPLRAVAFLGADFALAGAFFARRLGRSPAAAALDGALRRLGGQPLDGLLHRHRLGLDAAGQRGHDLAVADIGAVAAGEDLDRLAAVGMRPDLAQRLGAGPGLGGVGGQQVDGAVHADLQHILFRRQVLVLVAMLQIGPVAADASQDRLARLRVPADLARQRQQSERLLQRHRHRVLRLGQRGALRLLALLGLVLRAELGVDAVGALADRHRQAGLRIVAQQARQGRVLGAAVLARGAERPGVAAFRIVRAADEGCRCGPASGRAGRCRRTGTAAGRCRRPAAGRNAVRQRLVQRRDDVADLEVLGPLDRGVRTRPRTRAAPASSRACRPRCRRASPPARR